MSELYVSRVIPAPVEAVWDPVRTFTAVQYWYPGITEMRIKNDRAVDQVGAIRRFMNRKNNWVEEKLIALSERDYHLVYRKLTREEPLRDYVGNMRLHPVTNAEDSTTFVEWWVDLDVDPAHRQEIIQDYSAAFEVGLSGLEDYLRDS